MRPKFYVTTPIYYVNDKPHIGHAYTTIAADVLARYHRMLGKDVYYLTGTDENSQKNVEAAAKNGRSDDIQGYVDEMSAVWQETFDSLGISNNDFIRTTEERHLTGVKKFWQTVQESGDIYEGEYEGLYCAGCEAFITETDLIEGNCPNHKKPPEKIKEKNYFFKLTKYRETLLKHIKENPDFIQPKSRRNETVSYIDRFMSDISISRESMKWGIQVPGDEKQRIYVWFDALLNYMTGVGYGTDDEMYKKYWPADVHLVGKDIIKFHCALWPAMLMSAGLPLPRQVFAHGFFTIDGEKISKSLGNAIDPSEISNKYGTDTLRYFLLKEIKFGEDGDFSHDRLAMRYEKDLANDLGNLTNRVLSMTEQYFDSQVPADADGFLAGAWPAYQLAMEELRFHDALETTWKLIRESNKFIDDKEPWVLAKMGERETLGEVMYVLLETLRHIAWMIYPFMPETSAKLFDQLGLSLPSEFLESVDTAWVWGELKQGHKINKGEPLFPRLDK